MCFRKQTNVLFLLRLETLILINESSIFKSSNLNFMILLLHFQTVLRDWVYFLIYL